MVGFSLTSLLNSRDLFIKTAHRIGRADLGFPCHSLYIGLVEKKTPVLKARLQKRAKTKGPVSVLFFKCVFGCFYRVFLIFIYQPRNMYKEKFIQM